MVRPLFSAGLLILLALLLNQAPLNARPGTTSVVVPLNGTILYDDLIGHVESVTFDGSIHVSGQVTPKGPIRVQVNPYEVSGVGAETGTRYNVTGGKQATLDSNTVVFDLKIVPASGSILSCLLRVTLRPIFDHDGNLTDVVIEDLSLAHY